MNPRASIATRLRRAIPSSWVPFPCPVCERPIEIPRRDFGADLHCPHCTAWIAAPDPSLGRPAAIRDPRILEALRFQRTHGRELSELKEGVLRRSSLHRHGSVPSPAPPVASPAIQTTTPAPYDQLHNNAAALAPPSQTRLRPGIEPSLSFRPAEALTPPANAPDAIPEWDRGLGKAYPVPRPGIHLSTATKAAWTISSAWTIVAVAMLVARDIETRAARADAERALLAERTAREDAALVARQAESGRAHAAITAAQKALGAATWNEALPFVRHSARVAPLMERWHANNPWTPLRITPLDEGEIQHQDGRTFFIFTARDQTEKIHVFGLEDTPSGWMFDWEVFTDRATHEWLDFIATRPAAPQLLRAGVIRRTPTIRMLAAADVPGDEAFTVMLYGPNIADGSVFAVLRSDSPVATRLAETVTFDQARKFILDLRFLPVDPALPEKLVSIDRILETGWSFLGDADQVSQARGSHLSKQNR